MTYERFMIKDLQDLYESETEHVRHLTQLAAQAQNQTLRTALQDHADETEQQVTRLEQILEMVGETHGGDGQVTPGMQGLVGEADLRALQIEDPLLRDLALIAAAQKIEHYEIAWYGTARAMARTAGLDEAAHLLQTTLNEEEAADKRLTEIALPIHKQAAQADPALSR
jgi:ferritin-like metal-binding protein YciE